MMPVRKLLISFYFLAPLYSLAQRHVEVFQLINKKYFNETSEYIVPFQALVNRVSHDGPRIDDEFCYYLEIRLLDNAKFRKLKVFNVKRDSTFVRCNFEFQTNWLFVKKENEITGVIKLISQTKKKIKIELNLEIIDNTYNQKLIYNGIRTYTSLENL